MPICENVVSNLMKMKQNAYLMIMMLLHFLLTITD